jgi:putative ABC transport system permease protein
MDQLWRDIRFGFRMLIKHPTLSIISILTFGLGIGITTMVFSVVNGAFFKGLPFEEGDRVVALANTNPSRNFRNMPVSVQDYAVWQQRQTVFEALGPWSVAPINLTWPGGQPERFAAGEMSSGAFDTLRVKPILGRTFRSGEDRPGGEPAIILGYDLWRERYGSSGEVLGQTIRANGITRTIIGVMPEGFAFPDRQRMWIPLEIDPLATERGKGPNYSVIARLKKGVTIEEARAQAVSIGAQLEKEFPKTNQGIVATIRPFVENMLGPQIYRTLYTMLAAGIGVLLIACVNVANLLLARASLRNREIAVRMAVGASRSRVVLQFMTEVLILALAGGVVGFGLCSAGMKWFLSAITADPPPFFITFELDYRVMLFIVAITLAASLFAGLVPAFQATGKHVGEVLKDESRASTGLRIGRFSAGLIVGEVAISCGLLIAAGLMIKSMIQLKTIDLPFATEHIFTARINLPRLQYPDDPSCIQFYEQLLPKVEAISGVEAATLSDGLPAAGNGTVAFQVEGQAYSRDSDYPIVREGIVTPGYFKTFQTKVLRGREFTTLDRSGNLPVAVINESFARTYFPRTDPLGRKMKKGRGDSKAPWLTIVGLVPDMMMQGIGNNNQSGAGYYIPIAQSDVSNNVSIALRTRGEPGAVTAEVRAAVASMNADLAIFDVLSMKEVIARATWFYTIFGTFFMAFGFSALLLAVAGLYGVMSFAVTQRTREMGIRVALGAQGGQLVRLIMKKGAICLAIGLVIGLGIGLGASNLLQTLLYHVNPRDPIVLIAVLLALAAGGLAANFIPARRVTKIDPVVALAAE